MADEDHSNEDCFACVISSHGDQDYVRRPSHSGLTEATDVVYGVDGVLHLKTLMQLFKPCNCPTLAAKPKLFFIQVSNLWPGIMASLYANLCLLLTKIYDFGQYVDQLHLLVCLYIYLSVLTAIF